MSAVLFLFFNNLELIFQKTGMSNLLQVSDFHENFTHMATHMRQNRLKIENFAQKD